MKITTFSLPLVAHKCFIMSRADSSWIKFTRCRTKKDFDFSKSFSCGRRDLNPYAKTMHKILSLARLPIPTLPQVVFITNECYNNKYLYKSQHLFSYFLYFFIFHLPLYFDRHLQVYLSKKTCCYDRQSSLFSSIISVF